MALLSPRDGGEELHAPLVPVNLALDVRAPAVEPLRARDTLPPVAVAAKGDLPGSGRGNQVDAVAVAARERFPDDLATVRARHLKKAAPLRQRRWPYCWMDALTLTVVAPPSAFTSQPKPLAAVAGAVGGALGSSGVHLTVLRGLTAMSAMVVFAV